MDRRVVIVSLLWIRLLDDCLPERGAGTIPYHTTAATVSAKAKSSHRAASVSAVNTTIRTAHIVHCTDLLVITASCFHRPSVLSSLVAIHVPKPRVASWWALQREPRFVLF